MVEVAEAPPIASRKEIKASENMKSFTDARYIINLGESLINTAEASNEENDVNDGQNHFQTFGYNPESDTAKAIYAVGANGEPNPKENAFFVIAYKALPSQIENKRGAEIHIDGPNGLSFKVTYQRAENTEDEIMHIKSDNGTLDLADDKLGDSLQKMRHAMTLMLKEQRAREAIIENETKSLDIPEEFKPPLQQKTERTHLSNKRPALVKRILNRFSLHNKN